MPLNNAVHHLCRYVVTAGDDFYGHIYPTDGGVELDLQQHQQHDLNCESALLCLSASVCTIPSKLFHWMDGD